MMADGVAAGARVGVMSQMVSEPFLAEHGQHAESLNVTACTVLLGWKPLSRPSIGTLHQNFSQGSNQNLRPRWAMARLTRIIQQGAKARPIDDLSQSHINEAFESLGKVPAT